MRILPAALEWREHDGLTWLRWQAGAACMAFPTRSGGVSAPPFEGLNLAFSVADDPANVRENRRRWCAALGIAQSRLVIPAQVHSTAIAWVDEGDAGRGAFGLDTVLPALDGLLTRTVSLPLVVSYADCVPVAIVAEGDDGPALAVVHAGWRGMLAGIVGRAAAALSRVGRPTAAVIGPSIGPCCFTVGEEPRRRFALRFPGCVRGSAVDLQRCARSELEAAGVPPLAVAEAGICSADDERFFSHRRDAGLTGRHLAIAWLRDT